MGARVEAGVDGVREEDGEAKVSEAVVNLKQLRARIQVCAPAAVPRPPALTSRIHRRASSSRPD